MDCSKILPGAVNPGSCSVATGYLGDLPFICYASGQNLVFLDGNLKHIQTVLGADLDCGRCCVSCVHVAEFTGKVAASWAHNVVIFKPEQIEEAPQGKFAWSWKLCQTLKFTFKIHSISWNREGSRVLVGGESISMWVGETVREEGREDGEQWKEVWSIKMPSVVTHLKFSPDGTMFASAYQNDRLVKIWYRKRPRVLPNDSPQAPRRSTRSSKSRVTEGKREIRYNFTYVGHPRAVTGCVWRKTSPHMPRGAVPNVLLTTCHDNICRLWSHVIMKEKAPLSDQLKFFLAATIDPIADIPFRSTMPVEDAAFIVHWLNNKELTYTSRTEKLRQSASNQSLGSLAQGGPAEEMLASWVCVEESLTPEMEKQRHIYALEDYLAPASVTRGACPSPAAVRDPVSQCKKQLLDEWWNLPDLLVCIHPNNGSLMVWTVEGLDAPRHSTRLVHLSFSSCLPHVFPPHLAQTLHLELQQYLLKEPEVTSSSLQSTMNTSELSLPVPQIRLPGRGSMDIPDSTRTLRSDSSLILLSSHCNGSLNSWSVELTVQAGFCTSIAGLIHCGRTGGHRSEVNAVYRHPWLPVLMTVSSSPCHQQSDNELIVWNADLAGPLESKSQLQELSRVSSPESGSFSSATWLPPISPTSSSAEALSRCPSFGLFVTNIGRELCLFQTSLYPIIPPNSIGVYHTTQPLCDLSQKTITVTSHSGYNGISFVKTIDEDLGKYDEIIGLHTFRLSSIVLQESDDEEFDHSNEALIVLVENQKNDSVSHSSSFSPSTTPSCRTYLHVWKVVLIAKMIQSPTHKTANMDPWFQTHSQITSACEASVMKLFSGLLPLHNSVSHIVSVHPACDVSSSLQLQLPMLSSPYLFTTVSSDGEINNWQFHITAPSSSLESGAWKLVVYDVFKPGSYRTAMKSPAKILNCTTHSILKELPLQTHLPCALKSAYPGRFAMAHLLNKPLKTLPVVNPLGKHAVVSVWECESSGGLAWTCESVLPLHGFGIESSPSKLSSLSSANPVHMDWIPMENGSYLLATCFSSVISIFGMALPLVSSEEIQGKPLSNWQRRFSKSVSVPVFSSMQASSSWVCLLHFPCTKTYPGLSTQWLAYTGSNSILAGVGCEMHLYTCWVTKERLDALSSKALGGSASIRKNLLSEKHSRVDVRLAHSDRINLLDYAHSKNTPRPQYHPKILTDLLNMGKMDAVKLILVNLVKYLLLYQVKAKRSEDSEFVSFDERIRRDQEDQGPRMRMLSFADGRLQRSREAGIKVEVENIPPVSLSQLDLFCTETAEATSADAQPAADTKKPHKEEEDDDYDALFTDYPDVLDSDITLGETAETDDIKFPELQLDPSLFTPKMADKLRSILCYARLPDVSDLEQVHLLAIAETVAHTKMNSGVCQDGYSTTSLSIGGAGYASAGFVQGGIGGGEAMDDCGLRFLLTLHNHHMLSKSLPKDVDLEGLLPSNFVWAFHSDAESELLSNIPCVQEDKLNWTDLKSVGVGWWVRSNDTLRRLVEKLAKAQFMGSQDPMAASLFYLAMKKQSLLKGLFKTVSEQKMAQFFSNNFTQDRWHRAALKNAFVLISKQRFEHAAAFFLLAGQVWDAVKVCVERLHDLQLALVIVRLHEGDNSPMYEQVLKRFILGIDTKSNSCSYPEEPSPDPFLRSMALWLLRDYPGSLQTLLVEQQLTSSPANSSIYNFYFFLRSHPLLLRSKHPAKRGRTITPSPSVASFSTQFHHQNQLSGIGADPLTPTERNLVFNTAYFHLNSGSPLLSLMVLSQLPKCEDLGRAEQSKEELSLSLKNTTQRQLSSDSVSGMITSGTLTRDFSTSDKNDNDFDWSQPAAFQVGTPTKEVDEFDWSKPASSQLGVIKEVEEMDWSKPVFEQTEKSDDEFDWSQPVSSQVGGLLDADEPDWLEQEKESEKQSEEAGGKEEENEEVKRGEEVVCKALSPRGWFVICLAEQLQYNALLSILTEELTTIHLPACSSYLWNYSGGSDALPLLPVEKLDVGGDQSKSMVEWFDDEPFTQVLTSLQATLVDWLRNEIKLVKTVCRIEVGAGTTSRSPGAASHSGYDVLATLTNYMALHAGTLPSMVVVKMELMHLMNTLLPWSVGLSHPMEDSEGQMTTCAINPVQVPLLTSSALPAKHPLNLALHLRILSASIFDLLSVHSIPPTSNHPIDHIDRVFDLCCSLSHSIFLCLSPMRLQAADGSQQPDSRPESTGATTRQRAGSFSRVLDFLSTLDTPNTKASKWPGLDDWPHSLLSDDGKEASPLCLLLAECLAVVFVGLLAVAWSRHSIYDLLVVVANVPTPEAWGSLFGGGVVLRPQDGGGAQRRAAKWVSSMKKLLWQNSSKKGQKDDQVSSVGLFAAPKKSLLHHSLSKPAPRSNSPSCANFEKEPDNDSEDEYMSEEGEDAADPECFSWCLMNLCVIKIVQKSLRATVSLTGMETLEFITTSPVLYKLLGLLEDWETVFLQQMEDHAFTPPSLLQDDSEEQSFGPALMRHKFILEPENSPFRADSKQARLARRLWSYLVHEESVRETFIHYIFTNKKRIGATSDEEPPVQRILYHDPDSYVSSFCINASNSSVFALATTREVLEVEIPDITSLESLPEDIEGKGLWSSRSSLETPEDFILVQPSAQSLRRGSALLSPSSLVNRFPLAMHSQTGSASSMLLKRHLPGVKRMAAHPNLAYYLTGSADGSVRLYEFGIEKALSVLRKAGAGPGITRIRFTPQGNKYGVTDTSGKLCLWQGISTSSRPPYQTLNPSNTRRTISDFAFLGSSSLIATCGDFPEHRNICIWDTLLPARSNIVNEFMCHEGGASAIVYSNSTQRLVTGGKRGEIFIIDLRLQKIVTRVNAHATGVNTIVINDTENYFVSGSADGDIKVWDLFTVHELSSFAGKHARSRLFRSEGGVLDMVLDPSGWLYSCGADGTVKVNKLDMKHDVFTS